MDRKDVWLPLRPPDLTNAIWACDEFYWICDPHFTSDGKTRKDEGGVVP